MKTSRPAHRSRRTRETAAASVTAPPDVSSQAPSSRSQVAWVGSGIIAILTAGSFALNLYMAARTPLWFDEGHTYIVIRDGFGPLLGNLWKDVHPPLYFALVALSTRLLGTDPVSLRLVACLAGALTIPAIYATARLFAPTRWAVIGGLLVATHPLYFYYSHEARNYSLLVLLITCSLFFLLRLIVADVRRRDVGLLVVMLAASLQTHNMALFLFPCYLLGVLLAAGWRKAAIVGVCEVLAFLPYIPWFVRAAGAEEGIAWIGDNYWNGSVVEYGPLISIFKLTCGANFGVRADLRHLATVTGSPLIGGGLTIVILAATLLPARPLAGPQPVCSPSKACRLLWACLLALVIIWLYSRIRIPIYLIGRYDLVAFPPLLLLVVAGLHAFEQHHVRLLGLVLAGLFIFFNARGMAQMIRDADLEKATEELAAAHIAERGSRDDLLICLGFRLPLMTYFLDRQGVQLECITFPLEVSDHPGWYNAGIFLRTPERLHQDAEQTVELIDRALGRGGQVWIAMPGRRSIDRYLDDALLGRFVVDSGSTSPETELAMIKTASPKRPLTD